MLRQEPGCWPHLSFGQICVYEPRHLDLGLWCGLISLCPGRMAAKGVAVVPHAKASRFILLPSAVREPDWLPTALGSLCDTHDSRGQRFGAIVVLEEGRKVAGNYGGATTAVQWSRGAAEAARCAQVQHC